MTISCKAFDISSIEKLIVVLFLRFFFKRCEENDVFHPIPFNYEEEIKKYWEDNLVEESPY